MRAGGVEPPLRAPERVAEADDPRLADYRDLPDADRHLDRARLVAEGREVVRRLLRSRFRTRSLLLTESSLDALASDLEALDASAPVYLAQHDTLRRVAGYRFHRGCLAIGERGTATDPAEVIEPPGMRTLVALERLATPDNVGAVFRNAHALGASGVLLSPGCADPLARKPIRVSMGATLSVPFALVADWPAGLARLREAGFTLVALVPEGGGDLEAMAAEPPPRLALLVGNEGLGLDPETRALADREATIRMAAGVDSVNVATAVGIALHRLAATALL